MSSVYETKAWGVEDQPDFLNAICVVDDPARDHWAWLRTGQAAEQAAGRVRELRWGRALDVDVVTVDGVTSNDPELLLPHPGPPDRASVLAPWAEVEPAALLPGAGPIARCSPPGSRDKVATVHFVPRTSPCAGQPGPSQTPRRPGRIAQSCPVSSFGDRAVSPAGPRS